VAWSGKHSAWGKLLDSQADEVSRNQRGHDVDTPLRLRGQYYDAEAEIAYTRYRYFDADTCRWLSPDPIGLRGGRNLTSFNRSPTHVIDPLGLADGSPHGTPAEQAAAWQGQGDYPGVDEWTNTTIPKGTDPAAVTLDKAVELLHAREEKMKEQGKDPRAKKKKTANKSTAKKSTAKKKTKKKPAGKKKAGGRKTAKKKAAKKATGSRQSAAKPASDGTPTGDADPG